MADFATALALTLINEGGFFHDAETGELVNRGITLDTLRELGILKSIGPASVADIDFVQGLTEDETAQVYRHFWWDILHLDSLNDQELANKVFDLAVNTGTVQTTLWLQRIVNVKQDGVMGPVTMAALNSGNAAAILVALRLNAKAFYVALAEAHPALAHDLDGWLARLQKA